MQDRTGSAAPRLSTDLTDPKAVPYFLWDDPMTVREFRTALAHGPEDARIRLIAKLLREARDEEVWLFVTPAEVVRLWERLRPLLGRRRPFWDYLLGAWREEGLVA